MTTTEIIDRLAERAGQLEDKIRQMEHHADDKLGTLTADLRLIKLAMGKLEGGSDHGNQRTSGSWQPPLKVKDAEAYLPSTWSGESCAKSFNEFRYDVSSYLSILAPNYETDDYPEMGGETAR